MPKNFPILVEDVPHNPKFPHSPQAMVFLLRQLRKLLSMYNVILVSF